MCNLYDQYVELIRNHLTVYEVDAIECSLVFQGKTFKFDVGIFTFLFYLLIFTIFIRF